MKESMPSSAQPPHAAQNPRTWLEVSLMVDFAVSTRLGLFHDRRTSAHRCEMTQYRRGTGRQMSFRLKVVFGIFGVAAFFFYLSAYFSLKRDAPAIAPQF